MTPDQLRLAGIKLHGSKHWKLYLARDLGVNVATIHRMTHRGQVPGPYAIAIASLLAQKKNRDEIERAARKLLPKGYRKLHVRYRPPVKRGPRKVVLIPASEIEKCFTPSTNLSEISADTSETSNLSTGFSDQPERND